MIYNKKMTDKLIEALGPEVLEMSKNEIRMNLEDAVIFANNLLVDAKTESIRSQALNLYTQIKEVDNEYTELYIQELDAKVRESNNNIKRTYED